MNRTVLYHVYRGVYPFDQRLGGVYAPEDRPDLALKEAHKTFPKVVNDPPHVVTHAADPAPRRDH